MTKITKIEEFRKILNEQDNGEETETPDIEMEDPDDEADTLTVEGVGEFLEEEDIGYEAISIIPSGGFLIVSSMEDREDMELDRDKLKEMAEEKFGEGVVLDLIHVEDVFFKEQVEDEEGADDEEDGDDDDGESVDDIIKDVDSDTDTDEEETP